MILDKNVKEQKCWYVVYTRSRYEKRVHEELLKQGIEAFLPTQKTIRQWSDRKKVVELPLFTGYVFVNIQPAEYYKVLHTDGVVKYIAFEGKAVIVPQRQIDNLLLLVDSSAEVETSEELFEAGQNVEVSVGSLKGLTGELIKENGKSRVLIRIDHLEQNLLVSIPRSHLKKSN